MELQEHDFKNTFTQIDDQTFLCDREKLLNISAFSNQGKHLAQPHIKPTALNLLITRFKSQFIRTQGTFLLHLSGSCTEAWGILSNEQPCHKSRSIHWGRPV